MKPYFDTSHAAGLLILVALLAWGTLELAQRSQQQERKGATRIGRVTRTITGTGLAVPAVHNSLSGTAAGLLPMAVTSYYRRRQCRNLSTRR
jgi:hypothetical protein